MSFIVRDTEAVKQEISVLYNELSESSKVLQSTPKDSRSMSRDRDSGMYSEQKSKVPQIREKTPIENNERDTGAVNSDIIRENMKSRQKVGERLTDSSVMKEKLREGSNKSRVSDCSERNNSRSSSKAVVFKQLRYDGTTSWLDYESHFEMCAIVNEWESEQQGLYLAVYLSGLAQSVHSDVPLDMRKNYDVFVKALEDRVLPASQTELYRVQMKERRQKASESLPELGQSIRRLANLAYPSAPLDVKETLAKEQF